MRSRVNKSGPRLKHRAACVYVTASVRARVYNARVDIITPYTYIVLYAYYAVCGFVGRASKETLFTYSKSEDNKKKECYRGIRRKRRKP